MPQFIFLTNKLLRVYISLMDSVGEGEGGEIWENGIETKGTQTLLYINGFRKLQVQNESAN